MRGSFFSKRMRTFTVAFSRFAVGTMAITEAGGCLAARHHIAGSRQVAGRLVIRCGLLGLLRRLRLRGGLLCSLRYRFLGRILPAELVSAKGGESDDGGENCHGDR